MDQAGLPLALLQDCTEMIKQISKMNSTEEEMPAVKYDSETETEADTVMYQQDIEEEQEQIPPMEFEPMTPERLQAHVFSKNENVQKTPLGNPSPFEDNASTVKAIKVSKDAFVEGALSASKPKSENVKSPLVHSALNRGNLIVY